MCSHGVAPIPCPRVCPAHQDTRQHPSRGTQAKPFPNWVPRAPGAQRVAAQPADAASSPKAPAPSSAFSSPPPASPLKRKRGSHGPRSSSGTRHGRVIDRGKRSKGRLRGSWVLARGSRELSTGLGDLEPLTARVLRAGPAPGPPAPTQAARAAVPQRRPRPKPQDVPPAPSVQASAEKTESDGLRAPSCS